MHGYMGNYQQFSQPYVLGYSTDYDGASQMQAQHFYRPQVQYFEPYQLHSYYRPPVSRFPAPQHLRFSGRFPVPPVVGGGMPAVSQPRLPQPSTYVPVRPVTVKKLATQGEQLTGKPFSIPSVGNSVKYQPKRQQPMPPTKSTTVAKKAKNILVQPKPPVAPKQWKPAFQLSDVRLLSGSISKILEWGKIMKLDSALLYETVGLLEGHPAQTCRPCATRFILRDLEPSANNVINCVYFAIDDPFPHFDTGVAVRCVGRLMAEGNSSLLHCVALREAVHGDVGYLSENEERFSDLVKGLAAKLGK